MQNKFESVIEFFERVIGFNAPKLNLGEQLTEHQAQELLKKLRALVLFGWHVETDFIICYYLFYIGNGCKILDRSEQSIFNEICKKEWHPSKYSRLVKAAKMAAILGIEPGVVPPGVFRSFTKDNEENWMPAWKLACENSNKKFPTAKVLEEAFDQLKEESAAETPDEPVDNVDSKTPKKGGNRPTPSTDDAEEADSKDDDVDTDSEVDSDESNPPAPKQKVRSTTTPGLALKRIKKWNNTEQTKRLIKVLNGKSTMSKACIDIIQNFTEDERHQLVSDLRDLIK